MLKIRRSRDRFIFDTLLPILVRRHLYIEPAPDCMMSSIYCIERPNMFIKSPQMMVKVSQIDDGLFNTS